MGQAKLAADGQFVQSELNKKLLHVFESGRFATYPWQLEKTPL